MTSEEQEYSKYSIMIIRQNKIIKTIFSVTSIIIFAKCLGFVKQMVIAGTYGTSVDTDVISLSQNVIGDIDYLLVQVLLTSFIPIYIGIKERDESEASRFVTNSLVVSGLVTAFCVICVELMTPIISRVIAPSYEGVLLDRLTMYIRIYAPSVCFMTICALFNALLRSNERFVPGELVSIIQSVIMILSVVFFHKQFGINALVIGYLAYIITSFAYLLTVSKREWKFNYNRTPFDQNTIQLISMSLPLFLGYSMVFVNQQVDKIITSGLGVGIVTALSYAGVLINLISTLVGAVCSILFTYISKNVAEGKEKEAARLVIESTCMLITLFFPIMLITISNSKDIIRLVYERGQFSEKSVNSTSLALMGYGFSIAFFPIRELYSRLQYSYKDSRSPMINSIVGIIINIILSILLSKKIGIAGVTVASSVSVLICSALNIITSRKHNKYISFGRFMGYLPYWCIGGVTSVMLSTYLRKLLCNYNENLRFIFIVIVLFLTYFIICLPPIIKIRDILYEA